MCFHGPIPIAARHSNGTEPVATRLHDTAPTIGDLNGRQAANRLSQRRLLRIWRPFRPVVPVLCTGDVGHTPLMPVPPVEPIHLEGPETSPKIAHHYQSIRVPYVNPPSAVINSAPVPDSPSHAFAASSWSREKTAKTPEQVAGLLHDQLPFHFADPHDPRVKEYAGRTGQAVYSPEVLRHFAGQEYGGIEVEERLKGVTQPMLVLAGRHDRTCSVDAAEAIARDVPNAQLVVFEHSGHMLFVEEQERYIEVVRRATGWRRAGGSGCGGRSPTSPRTRRRTVAGRRAGDDRSPETPTRASALT